MAADAGKPAVTPLPFFPLRGPQHGMTDSLPQAIVGNGAGRRCNTCTRFTWQCNPRDFGSCRRFVQDFSGCWLISRQATGFEVNIGENAPTQSKVEAAQHIVFEQRQFIGPNAVFDADKQHSVAHSFYLCHRRDLRANDFGPPGFRHVRAQRGEQFLRLKKAVYSA